MTARQARLVFEPLADWPYPDAVLERSPFAAPWRKTRGIVELFGRWRGAGRISEVERFGGKLLRLDIPDGNGPFVATQLIGHGSIYRLTLTTEDTARRVAAMSPPAPVQPWELLAAPGADEHDVWGGRDD